MKKSEKLINKAEIPLGLDENDRLTYENNVLLRHVIDNDLPHIWGAIKIIAGSLIAAVGAMVGACIKFLVGK
jgi:hypothetical protein